MLIFAIDSSAVSASAAVLCDEKLLGEFFVNIRQTHSQTLMPMAEELLKLTGKKPGDFDRFAVSAGPGSFTGVRIGISCIKGMAQPFNIPCCGISTLEVIAYGGISLEGKVLCAVMDARCGQVYNALFRAENGHLRRLCNDRALSVKALAEECGQYASSLVLLGDGTDVCLPDFLPLGASAACEAIRYQRASSTAMLAQEYPAVSHAELVPFYLRPPQAERNLKKQAL